MNKNQILAALPKLSQADLAELAAVISHLQNKARTAGKPEGAITVPQLLFDALAATVGASMRLQNLPPPLLKKLNTQAGPLKQFLDTDFKGWDENKLTQTAFLTFLMSLLTNMLTAYGTKPSVRTMILNLDKLPKAFDEEFPDYRLSGMGHMVLRRFQRK